MIEEVVMKVIALNGSPRIQGNTCLLIEKVFENICKFDGIETEQIHLGSKKISPCTGCYGCIDAKKCIIEDDFQDIYQKMLESDGIILASPVYHSCITPYLKSVLDRAGFSSRWQKSEMKEKNETYLWEASPLSQKIVAPITVARRAGQNFAFAELLLWASANDCIIVGNTYWNMAIAGKGGSVGIEDDPEGVRIMESLGRRLASLILQLRQ